MSKLGRPGLWLVANVAATLVVLGYSGRMLLEIARRVEPAAATDFIQYYLSAQAILNGQSAYTGLIDRAAAVGAVMWIDAAPYPPAFQLLIVPFTAFPHATAWWLWTIFNLVLVALAVWLIVRTQWASFPRSALVPLVAGVVIFPPLGYQVVYGNVSALLFVAITGIWWFYRAGRYFAAGLVLGLACALKPVPAPIALYFLWQGNKRALAGTVVGFAAGTAMGVFPLGPGEISRYYLEVMPILNQFYAGIGNASFFGFGAKVAMLLTEWDLASASAGLSLATSAVAAVMAVAALGFALDRIGRRPATGERADVELALFSVVVLLVSPISWPHYLIVLYLPALIWLRRIWYTVPRDLGLLRGLTVAFTLVAIPSPTDDVVIAVAGWFDQFSPQAAVLALLAISSVGCAALTGMLWVGRGVARQARLEPAAGREFGAIRATAEAELAG